MTLQMSWASVTDPFNYGPASVIDDLMHPVARCVGAAPARPGPGGRWLAPLASMLNPFGKDIAGGRLAG